MLTIKNKVYARIGLLGNPSDGYNGKTISLSLQNFYAEVELSPSSTIKFLPHPVFDNHAYENLTTMKSRMDGEGFYGGLRLIQAAAKVFVDHCHQHGITLPDKGFTMSYDSNIPRQTGLSGSSAIVVAALNCLMEYFGVADQIPVPLRPAIALAAEQLLGITAGLQDRVIQVYGGLVFMDFNEAIVSSQGHGAYQQLDPGLLPPLLLMYSDNPSESGKVHSNVRQRWLAGEPAVREGMQEVAGCAEQGRLALEKHDVALLAELMNKNFDLRRQMFGDATLGARNLRMIELARSAGAAAKFTGSGGAAVVLCRGGQQQVEQLHRACGAEGFTLVEVQVAGPYDAVPV